jgi:hypothetical protein
MPSEIEDADDGETVAVENVNALKEINFGGASDDAYKYMAMGRRPVLKERRQHRLARRHSGRTRQTLGQTEIVAEQRAGARRRHAEHRL